MGYTQLWACNEAVREEQLAVIRDDGAQGCAHSGVASGVYATSESKTCRTAQRETANTLQCIDEDLRVLEVYTTCDRLE